MALSRNLQKLVPMWDQGAAVLFREIAQARFITKESQQKATMAQISKTISTIFSTTNNDFLKLANATVEKIDKTKASAYKT